jgi:S-adenosylmethionine uptake transporter
MGVLREAAVVHPLPPARSSSTARVVGLRGAWRPMRAGRGIWPVAPPVPRHARSGAAPAGVAGAVGLWFHAIGTLPLATAMTLNCHVLGVDGRLLRRRRAARARPVATDGRLVAAVLAGFAGVAAVLRPTMRPGPAGCTGSSAWAPACSSAHGLPAGDGPGPRPASPGERAVLVLQRRRDGWRAAALTLACQAGRTRTTAAGSAQLLAQRPAGDRWRSG